MKSFVMKWNHSLFTCTIMSVTVLLSACGFHLRGAVELPPELQETYLQSGNPYTGMARALRNELQAAGATIMESSEQATAILTVVGERSENRILSVGSTGKATEYELFEEVVFSVSDVEGNVLIEPQTLRMIRALVFDENELLGKIREAEQIHIEMRRSLARQIITRIGAGFRQQ